MAKIYLDPGHGGRDPGANANGVIEKKVALQIALKTREYLVNDYKNANVKLSRTGDSYPSLSQRYLEANGWGADIFVSIHLNAGGGRGFESYIFNGTVNAKTRALQNAIHDEVIKVSGVYNRGKKRANFAVLRGSKMPAVLTENLFVDNKSEATNLKKTSFVNKLAKAHAVGIAKAVGLSGGSSTSKPKPSKPTTKPSKPTTKPTPSTIKGDIKSKVDGLRFYNKPSWNDKDLIGTVKKGYGFPTVVRKLKVGKGYQYEVKNSKGHSYYITASSKYVVVDGSVSTSTPKPSKPVKIPLNLPHGVFKRGSSGARVKQIQRGLNKARFNVGKVDGKYGTKTKDAVYRLQLLDEPVRSLKDGIYGARTRKYLMKRLGQ